MRWVLGLVGLLVAMAIVLSLASRDARKSLDAVGSVSTSLREQNAEARPFDAGEAERAATRLRELIATPDLPADELRRLAGTAASWAAGSTPGSNEYRMAVAIRGAAGALLSAGPDLGHPGRVEAARLLAAAKPAPGGPPQPGAIGGIQDQLKNLQYSEREKIDEAQKEAH